MFSHFECCAYKLSAALKTRTQTADSGSKIKNQKSQIKIQKSHHPPTPPKYSDRFRQIAIVRAFLTALRHKPPQPGIRRRKTTASVGPRLCGRSRPPQEATRWNTRNSPLQVHAGSFSI